MGYGGFRGWSADGETWTAERWSDKNADDINIIFSLPERNGILLCSGGGVGKGFILRSTDGKHWDEVVRTRWRIPCAIAMSATGVVNVDENSRPRPVPAGRETHASATIAARGTACAAMKT